MEVIWQREKFKSLGVWFTLDEYNMSILNLNEKLNKLKN